MSDELIDFLRADKDLEEVEVEDEDPEAKGEKLRVNLFNDEYAEIDIDNNSAKGSWVFPTIYKTDSHGNTLFYQIGYNSISKKVLWLVGRVETGAMSLFSADVVPTRAQKGSYSAKAHAEALVRYQNKLKNGFHVGITGLSALPIGLPMLANKYQPPDEDGDGNVPSFPVMVQPKFDGERHLVSKNERTGSVIQLTRKMNERGHFEHVKQESGRLLDFLPPGTVLDGELYSNRVSFQTITSIVGAKNKAHPREKELDYFVFDIYHPDTVWKPGMSKKLAPGVGDRFEDMVYMRASGYTVENYEVEAKEYYELPEHDETVTCKDYHDIIEGGPLWVVEVRVALLMNAFRCYREKYGEWPQHVKLVKSYIVHSLDGIEKIFGEITRLNIGGPEHLEGVMIRHLSRSGSNPALSLYRPGRSNNLLKVKGLHSTEVLITGVRPGKNRAKDLAVLLYKEPGTGIIGSVVPAVSHAERRTMLLNPELVKGRMMKVSYQNRLASGALRFPVGVAFVK